MWSHEYQGYPLSCACGSDPITKSGAFVNFSLTSIGVVADLDL